MGAIHAAIYGYKMANYSYGWINVYDDLGTVLTDTFTTQVFLRNFSGAHTLYLGTAR